MFIGGMFICGILICCAWGMGNGICGNCCSANAAGGDAISKGALGPGKTLACGICKAAAAVF
jgi:hypothetical protein